MLSSIHPLGERARHNRWTVTVGSFLVAALAASALAGALLGSLGSMVALDRPVRVVVMLAAAGLAGLLDLARVRPPGPRRQVNEDWIGSYRGWVYGGAFGAQLGLGLVTFVVTWGVYAAAAAAFAMATPAGGAMVGTVFAAVRGLGPLAAGWIDRPSRLSAFHRLMARAARPAAVVVGAGLALVGLVGLVREVV